MQRRYSEYKTPPQLAPLVNFLRRVPTVTGLNGGDAPGGFYNDARWWVVFEIAIADPLGWRVVRRLAEVFNDASSAKTPPTVFMPVVPEESGGIPSIWWAVESTRAGVPIADIIEQLEKRLPQPIENQLLWS